MSIITTEHPALDGTQARLVHLRQTRAAQNAAWDSEERDLLDSIEQHLLDLRPAYPTSEQRDAISEVARLIHEQLPHGSEHFIGDPVLGSSLVLFSSPTRRINVRAGAPYAHESSHSQSTRMWSFSDQDMAAFRDLIESHGLTITNSWRHDDGIAFIVAPAHNAE